MRQFQSQNRLKADGLLNEPPLTMLLSAQAAQLNGDDGAATGYFEAMLERKETEFLGLRGLLNHALKRDDRVKALTDTLPRTGPNRDGIELIAALLLGWGHRNAASITYAPHGPKSPQ